MVTINYATFSNPELADQAFVELMDRGASASDLVVVTKSSYKDESTRTEDGRLTPAEESTDAAPSAPTNTNALTAEALLGGHSVEHFSPGTSRLLLGLRFAGDLTDGLKELGFAEHDATTIENLILSGGALLISMTPTGSLTEDQIANVISNSGGTALSKSDGPAYLG